MKDDTGSEGGRAAAVGGRLDAATVDPGVQADLVGTYFRLLGPLLSDIVDRKMADHPVGPGVGKISTLQAICNNPGISQMELSEMFGRDRSLQFRIVTDLEKRGLIRREVDPTEKRRHCLYPTEMGAALMPELEVIVRKDDRKTFSAVTDEEYALLVTLLRRVFLEKLGPGAVYWRNESGD